MIKKRLIALAIAASLILSVVPSQSSYANSEALPEASIEYNLSVNSLEKSLVTFEVSNSNGKPAIGSTVFITSLISNGEEIFSTKVGKDGIVEFQPQIDTTLIETAPGNVFDVTYEAIFHSPNGESAQTYFSVPFVKESAELSQDDVRSLNETRNQKIKVDFSGKRFVDELLEKKNERLKQELQSTLVEHAKTTSKVMPSTGCVAHVSGLSYSCVIETRYYTAPVKIASANVAKDETVDFSFDSGATTKMSWGQKATATAGWSIGGSLSKSVDVSTGVDFSAPGTCKIFWGVTTCNLQRDFYVNYQFMYTVTDYYTQDKVYVDTEYKIVPTTLSGPAPLNGNEWVYNSNNGKPKNDVAKSTNPYGTWHAVYLGASRNKSYTQEFTYGAAIDIPAIGFSGSVTTSYKNKHTMVWKTSSNKTFYHYDINNNGQNWYVTH